MVKVNGTPYLVVEIDGDRFGGLEMDSYQWDGSYIYDDSVAVEWFDKEDIDDKLREELLELLSNVCQDVVLEAVFEVGLLYYDIYRKIEDVPQEIISKLVLGKIRPDRDYAIDCSKTGVFIAMGNGDEFYTDVTDIKAFLKDGTLLYDYSKEDLKNLINTINKQ